MFGLSGLVLLALVMIFAVNGDCENFGAWIEEAQSQQQAEKYFGFSCKAAGTKGTLGCFTDEIKNTVISHITRAHENCIGNLTKL